MFNLTARLATSDIEIKNEKRITQANLDREMLVFAGDVAAAQLARTFDPTLQTPFKEFPKSLQSELTALTNGVNDILRGVPFTVNIENNPYADGRTISSFAMRSTSRAEIIYQPTIYDCQCEGHLHHGVCKHRFTRTAFVVYVAILHGQEYLQALYARLGVELKPVTAPKIEGPLAELLAMMGEFDADFANRGH